MGILKKVAIGVGATTIIGGGGAALVYRRRLQENRSTTAVDYNAKQDQEALQAAFKTLKTKDCVPIQMYRYTTCPFCGKVKAFLDYHKIPHECVEVEPMFKGEIKGSEYKKVPQLRFLTKDGKEGPYLVDSDIIVDTLAKQVGAEAQLSDPDVAKWRAWARNQLVRFLVVNINSSLTNAWQGYEYIDAFDTIPTWNKWFLKIMGAPVMYMVATNMTAPTLIKNGDMQPGDDARKRLLEEVNKFVDGGLQNGKREFHGGKKPDIADLDIYGVMQSVRGHRVYEDIKANTAIDPWLQRMDALTGKK